MGNVLELRSSITNVSNAILKEEVKTHICFQHTIFFFFLYLLYKVIDELSYIPAKQNRTSLQNI
jgi:hypothetical protein